MRWEGLEIEVGGAKGGIEVGGAGERWEGQEGKIEVGGVK